MTVEQDIINLRTELTSVNKKLDLMHRKELSITTTLSRDLVDVGLAPCASMRQQTAQSVADSTWTKITMDTLIFDFMGDSVKLADDRIIARRGGIYLCIGQTKWAANATGSRFASVYVNGVTVEGSGDFGGYATHAGHTTRAPALAIINVKVGDYFELFGFQDSGAALLTNVSVPKSFLSVILLSRGTS